MISRIKTDHEIIQEAARALAIACDGAEYETACADMVETLRYGRSVQWWSQFEREAAPQDQPANEYVRDDGQFGMGA